MPRTYIPNPGGKVYRKPDLGTIQKAREAVEKRGVSIRQASKKYEIPYTVLQRHLKGKVKHIGGQTVLSEEEEQMLVERLLVCAEWGYPLDLYGLRLIVKSYLDSRGKVVAKNDSSDDSFSEDSIHRPELEESKVTKFGRTFNNIEPVSKDDIHVNDWVLIGFAAETGSKPGPTKLLYYIGQVLQKIDNDTFEASFLRCKQTRDFSGHIYVFPAVLDFSSFTSSQVVGKLSEPEVIRRGWLKFKFNHNSVS